MSTRQANKHGLAGVFRGHFALRYSCSRQPVYKKHWAELIRAPVT